MIVEKLISRTIDSKLFDIFLKAINYEVEYYGLSERKEVVPIMKQKYNVIINEATKSDDGTNVHLVIFDSEQDYAWFMLRWA